MGGAESPWKVVWGPLALLFVSSATKILIQDASVPLMHAGLGWCPPKWIPYRDEFCLYLPTAPALSWKEARAFCQDQKADLVVIKDYSKQMFLRDHTEGARGHASYFWIGLAWREAQLTWVDGTPISQSWYSHWLQGHPGKKHCTQLVGIYAAQWRDWDCEASTSFICEKPMKDAFSSSTRKVRFRSHCYVFHFPSLREQRSWGEAQSFCQELGGNLAVIHDEEENTFLSSAFPEDGWYLWIGLHLEAMWKWSDASAPTYLRWDAAPSAGQDRCVVLSLRPLDGGQHGTWKARPCQVRPAAEYVGFICQLQYDSCGPPEPVRFLLPGGMGPYATADVTFSLTAHATFSLVLTCFHPNGTLFLIIFEYNATHIHGSIFSEQGRFLVHKNYPRAPFSPGLNTWSFISYPDGFACFFNHQEHFRLSDSQNAFLANISSLQISGATVANASLEYPLSSDLRFPHGNSLQLEDAVHYYLCNFTFGLWIRSAFLDSPRMCAVSYSLKWQQQAEFALFLLSPSGLEFHAKGALLFSGTRVLLLDGSWHHLAVSVTNTPGVAPFKVFVDGETWQPDVSESGGFLWKGLSLGGRLSLGQLEGGHGGASFYVGDLSEVNLWDRALSEFSVKQLSALRNRWKFPGNVVSWSQLVAKKPPGVQFSPTSEEPDRPFVWFGLLRLRGKALVLCTDPERSILHIQPLLGPCATRALWGLQLNGRLRNVADPPACLLVASGGSSVLSSWDCSPDARSSFRLLQDMRLQNLHSGLCLFQEAGNATLYLGKCTLQALFFFLDWDVHCLHSRGWRPWKDRCLFFVLDAALEWSQAQRFCQRFHGGSLLSLNSPQDLMWLQGQVPGSLWTGLHSSGRDLWSWLDGTRFNQALKRFMFFLEPSSMAVCMLALTSGFLKAEPCHRPHRWICQAPRQSDLYMTFPGKSFVGTKIADLSFPSLQAAKQQCSALGEGCDVVVSTMTGHHLMMGKRFVTLEDPGAAAAAAAAAAVHVKTRCSPGYSGQDCQSMCPRCEPSLSCNPLTGLCDGFLYYREAPALIASLKCLPLEVWIFERGSCWSYERYSSQVEAKAVCKRYLGSTVRKVPPLSKVPAGPSADGRRGFQQPGGSLWACQRGEDVKLPSFREKLLLPHQEAAPEQRHASWQEAEDACYLQKERCTGLLSLKGAHYTVAGTVLVDSPGSGALLSVKAACSPGFCGKHCQRRSSPCLSTHTYNPLTGRCDGSLSCVRRFSPSCLHGLVHSRCPRGPGWWFWGGHCYYVEEQGSKSWQEAKAACQAYGENVTLLVLSSAKEKAWVAAMVQRGSWTGLSDAGGVWRWEEGRADSLSLPWLPNVPLVSGGCLEIRPRGDPDLAASPCSHLRPWVCEGLWAPLSSCPAEPGWSHWNGSCYLWDSSSAGAWPEALEACRRFRKTELLYLTTLQEMDWVRSHFQGTFWTGLNDRKEESVFRWSALEPLSKQVAHRYLRDDMANGGRKDCVWFDSATGLLSDASCGEERPFLCKCPEATEWFDQWTGYGMVGEPSLLYPSAETLEGAKRECLLERPVCVAVLETRSGFYLLSSKDDASPKADSVLHVWTICAEGFSGLACRKTSAGAARPACDCSGTLKTTAEKVCGVPVQTCVEDCQQMTPRTNCSFCIPVCTEASLSFLDPEEFALVTMIQFKVSHSLNLTTEDERDRTVSSKVVYDDTKYP
ncbi:uncharacterized protein LOC117676650 isoform X1 [Pantherophis guttatus]|uniref:Uncharacterized protein LOC117676650 isoform X1 n=1 Tax=Pantherophis guttatus TaxID=94885 RepID=A0A6P9D7M5_PANGU|nr:uncharacterized protein LOC117676650 isoform X1 [Pantherophis guttatus]